MSCDVCEVSLTQVKQRNGCRTSCDVGKASFPNLPSLHLRHSSFSNPSAALPTSQLILQPFRCFSYVLGTSRTSPGKPPIHRGMKNRLCWTSFLQQFTKFRNSYSFGQLLRILLQAVNFLSYTRAVSSDSSFNIHNALYFVKYPSRATQNSPEGHRLKTPALTHRATV